MARSLAVPCSATGSGWLTIAMTRDLLYSCRHAAIRVALLAGILAAVGSPGTRKNDPKSPVDEIVGANNEAVLLTRTAPPGRRVIEVSRWEDLVKAADIMGRPILRLDDGTRSPDQPLFYIPDGPQSYVFDFQREGVNVSKSGGYAPSPVAAPAAPSPMLSPPEPMERIEPLPAYEPIAPEPVQRPSRPPGPNRPSGPNRSSGPSQPSSPCRAPSPYRPRHPPGPRNSRNST